MSSSPCMARILRVRGPSSTSLVRVTHERDVSAANPRALWVEIRLPPVVLQQLPGGATSTGARGASASGSTARNGYGGSADPTMSESELEDFSDELSSLDIELNKALSSVTTVAPTERATQPDPEFEPTKVPPPQVEVKLEKTTLCPAHTIDAAKPHPDDDYRYIPTNLTETIRKELTNDDDVGIISKMIFTLKDPLSATKISLPVKLVLCLHFECFDFDTFCVYSKIPDGIKYVTRKDLAKRNYDRKRYEKERRDLQQRIQKQPQNRALTLQLQHIQRSISIPAYTAKFNPYHFAPPKIPVYKCPICDCSFLLHQLYISDAYNYFVKTTPRAVNRVELVDMIKYRILDDRIGSSVPSNGKADDGGTVVVILSDEEEEETAAGKPKQEGVREKGHNEGNANALLNEDEGLYNRTASEEIFNDGLDEALFNLDRGAGSWEDPVTID